MVELDYTGHPLFDVGLATIVAYCEKEYPTELTEDDLHKAAQFVEDNYTEQPLTSFLTTSLMNSDFTQPAFKDNMARRVDYARRVAHSFGDDVPKSDETCVFTGKPALGVALSLKRDKEGREELAPGRAFRQHIPLITSENIINFSPWADPGLPVSGEALLCLQFFPMGCRKCAGRLLAVHSDNPDILQAAAKDAWQENVAAITLARASLETKLPDASSSAPSLVIETIIKQASKQTRIQQAHIQRRRREEHYSVTAYHLTNSGQSSPLDEKSPPLKIYLLPMSSVRFLHIATTNPDYIATWNRLVAYGQQRLKPAKDKQGKQQEGTGDGMHVVRKGARNYFYEDIFRLPQEASRFIRSYFLRVPDLYPASKDAQSISENTTSQYSTAVIPWSFVDLFLQEVMHMEKKRIGAIKELADRLAAYVDDSGDKRFFRNFYLVSRGDLFRNELLRAAKNAASPGKAPLFTYESFCTVFFAPDGDEDLRFDWKLARDLTFIRMLEWLSEHDKELLDHMSVLTEERTIDAPTTNNEQEY
jgi:CRISPR-associated protein Cst1